MLSTVWTNSKFETSPAHDDTCYWRPYCFPTCVRYPAQSVVLVENYSGMIKTKMCLEFDQSACEEVHPPGICGIQAPKSHTFTRENGREGHWFVLSNGTIVDSGTCMRICRRPCFLWCSASHHDRCCSILLNIYSTHTRRFGWHPNYNELVRWPIYIQNRP